MAYYPLTSYVPINIVQDRNPIKLNEFFEVKSKIFGSKEL
jgi:hypothetical protein